MSVNREFERVRDSMRSAITMSKTEIVDTVLNDFSEVKLDRLYFSSLCCICFVDFTYGEDVT